MAEGFEQSFEKKEKEEKEKRYCGSYGKNRGRRQYLKIADMYLSEFNAGNIIALLHAFYINLPQEWLETSHTIVKHLRPVTSVAMLRIAFRILGPLLPRLAFARPLFMKVSI